MNNKIISYLKNKYIIASALFCLYALFLDDYDIFTLITQKNRLTAIENKKKEVDQNLYQTKETLSKLEGMENVGGTNIWSYRGGFYNNWKTGVIEPDCRHIWVAETRARKKKK